MSQRQRTFMVYFIHDAFHQGGLSLSVLPDECHLISSLNGQIGIFEDYMIAVCFTDSFHDNRIVSTTRRGRELQTQGRGIFFVHLYQFQFLQHLHTALYLKRLAVCTLEAFDKVLGFLNHFLLFLILLHLLLTAFLPQYKILRIVHLIIIDSSHRHFDGTCGNIIDKLTVVTDDYHCLGTVNQKIFQPLNRFNVQVVGRLIQQKNVRILQQQLGQFDTHTPSSAEITGRTVKVFPQESQSQQGLLHIFFKMRHVDGIELLAHGRHFLD